MTHRNTVSSASQALADLRRIDWTVPWLMPYAAQGLPLAEAAMALGSVWQALDQALSRAELRLPAGCLRAVPQEALPAGQAYEAFIADTACVPTRDGLHDFFNGLMWLHWPALKARLNHLQSVEIACRGIGGQRGPVRDALTLFDENGALWLGPQDLLQAWRRRQWVDLLWVARERWGAEVHCRLFGHALLEQLVKAPRPGLTAHVLAWAGTPCATAQADARALAVSDWAAKPFLPLPVSGVPAWWPDQGPAALRNARVFRPERPLQAASLGRKPSTDR